MTANCSVAVVTLLAACVQLCKGPAEVLGVIHIVLFEGKDWVWKV